MKRLRIMDKMSRFLKMNKGGARAISAALAIALVFTTVSSVVVVKPAAAAQESSALSAEYTDNAPVSANSLTTNASQSDSAAPRLGASKDEVIDGGSILDPTTGADTGLTWLYTQDYFTGETTLTISGEGAIPDYSSQIYTPWNQYISKREIDNIVIGDGITRVGDSSFSSAYAKTLKIGISVESIGRTAFSYNSFTELEIPGNVKTIEHAAFVGCTSLTKVTLNEGLESITNSFHACSKLTEIHIPRSVVSINQLGCVDRLEYITVAQGNEGGYYSLDGVLFKHLSDGTSQLVLYPMYKKDAEYEIPSFVSSIAQQAFYCNYHLRRVVIPSSVTSFDSLCAFQNAKALQEVIFEEGVKIGSNASTAFISCPQLKRVVVHDDSFSSTNYFRFQGCNSLGELYIPSGVHTFFGTATSNRNLKTVYYDVSGSSHTWFQSGTETANKYELTIGSSVDRIYAEPVQNSGPNIYTFKQVVLVNAGSVLFDGENQINIDEGVFNDMPVPLNSLSGTVWVDSQGVVYKYDSEFRTASVAYVPYGQTSINIPATIIPEDGLTCTVNSVDSYAFKLAEDLETLTFENPAVIESIGDYGMAYCSKLSQVNGVTTVEDATALFTNENLIIGYRPFYNTALTSSLGNSDAAAYIDGQKELEITSEGDQPMYISILDADGTIWNSDTDIGRYETLTGNSLSVNISVSSTDIQTTKAYRVYFETSELDASSSISPGNTINFNGTDITCYATEAPNIMYIEFTPVAGVTASASVSFTYPSPSSRGGNLRVWGVILSEDEAEKNRDKVIECETVSAQGDIPAYTKAIQAYYYTQPDEFSPVKTSTGSSSIALTGDGAGNIIPSNNLTYQIVYSRSSAETSAYGKDHVKTVDFCDSFDFGADSGISWSDEVIENIKNGDAYHANSTFYAGDIAIAGVTYSSGATIINPTVEYDDEKGVVFRWSLYNSSTTAEIATTTTNLTFYRDAFSFDSSKISADKSSYQFTNNVEAVTHYTYSPDQTSRSSAVKRFTVSAGSIGLGKTVTYNEYMGDTVDFTLTVRNDRALNYEDESGAVYTVEDSLNSYYYIKPENMERMFNDEYGKDLVITVADAAFSQWSEVKDVSGGAAYINAANSDNIQGSTDTLTISWNEDKTALQVTDSAGNVTDVEASLKETLQSLGYTATDSTVFSTVWTINDETTPMFLYGGERKYLYIYASFKDTFQMLNNDSPNCYGTESFTFNNRGYIYITTQDGTRRSLSQATAYNSQNRPANREAYIYKNARLNSTGETLTPNNLKPDDVIDYTVEFDHFGNGSYENLPLVDELYGTQVLLVPVERNPSLADMELETYELDGVSYYKLSNPGTYNEIVVGIDESGNYLLADSVTVTASNGSSSATIDGETHSYTGLHTEMKLYYSQTQSSPFYTELNYHVLVDSQLMTSTAYTIGGIAWMNDKPSDRIYASLWGSYSLINFNKEIVTQNSDGTYTADEDDYTAVGEGESVTYRMSFSNPNDSQLTLNGASFYDVLPFTADVFEWEKDVNVSLSYQEAEGVQVENLDNWTIENENGSYYMRWGADASITLDPQKAFSFYVTLTYPSDSEGSETYSAYCEAVNGERIQNSLYVYGYPETVYHGLKNPGSVILQKGVYATYRYQRINNVTPNGTYTQTPSRIYYSNADSTGRAVSYYVVLYNDGTNRLYLQDIYDQPPQGFTYFRLINSTTVNSTVTSSITTPTTNPFTDITLADAEETVSYKAATVRASASDDGILTFNISGGSGENAVKYDDYEEKYYLDHGEAIVFGYVCNIGEVNETLDEAENVIGMGYYDYVDAGVKAADTQNVAVNGKITDFYTEQNDGTLSVKNAEDIRGEYSFAADSSDGTQWLISNVTVNRGKIIPGVTCYTDSYTNDSGIVEPYTTSVSPYATVNWRARLHNSGESSITDYTFMDVLPSPYGLTGTVSLGVYDSISETPVASYDIFTVSERHDDYITVTGYNNTEYNLPLDGTSTTITVASGVRVNVSLTRQDNQETLKIDFADSAFSIPESGGYVDVTLSGRNVTTTYINSVYTNYATLIPNAQDYDSAAQGSLIYDENNEVAGVYNSSPVTVAEGYSTASVKTVEEIQNQDNSANSNADKRYIVLSDKDSEFKYTLTVTNDTPLGMTKLILIDSLPQFGDHSPFDADADRMSEFKVSLAEQPDFTVTIIPNQGESYVLDNKFYAVEYSSSQEFSSADWDGTSNWQEWTADTAPGDVRSIRLNIKDDEGTRIPAGARIEFSFNAKVDDENAAAGMTAWNSFGYHYALRGVSNELEAMPLPVGVKIPDVPSLQKNLVNLQGNEYTADENTQFNFVIYSGEAISGEYTGIEELTAALEANGRKYKETSLTVESGSSSSERLKLELEDFTWTEGENYTIVEIQNKEDYRLGSWNNRSGSSYTFTYDPDTSISLNCANIYQRWSFDILKVDATNNEHLLSGAVFAIYSRNSEDLMSDEAYESLSFKPDRTISDDEDVTWYLSDVQTTDESGAASFKNLLRESYCLVEVKAPNGYNLDFGQRIIDNNSASQQIRVTNTAVPQLPLAGVFGVGSYILPGLLLVAISLFMVIFRVRKNNVHRLR